MAGQFPKHESFRYRTLFLTLIAMLAIAFWTPVAFGQGATAALNGTVLDPTGRAVVGARVTLTAVGTNSSQDSITNDAGRYVFVALQPAQYVLKVQQTGFSVVVTEPFTLAVNQTLVRDIALAVGAATQQVTVATSSVNIETTTTELGTAIQNSQVAGLPLNGRNFTQLLELTPGVSPIDTDQSSGTGFGGHAVGTFTFPSVSGQPNRSTMFLLDGFTDYGFLGTYAVAPIVDDIQEFKVQSHNDTSAYGGAMGGIVNVVTRGGTSQYHGSIWEFIRNSAFDAKNYFNTRVTPYKQNQFGAAFGGPLIPHKLMKRDSKTFFFAAYEGFRSDEASEIKDLVPTQSQLSGNFSNDSAPIYNPYTTAPDPVTNGYTRTAFTGNQITPGLINTGLQAYAKAIYPVVTTLPVNGFNFVDYTPDLVSNDTGEIRVDHRFNDQWAIWGTFNKFYSPVNNATGFPGITSVNNEWGYQTGGNMTYATHDGRSILAARFGRTWAYVNLGQNFSGSLATAYQLGNFNSQFVTGFIGGRNFNPGMTIPGYATMPEGQFQGNNISNIWEGAADFTHVAGRHTLQVGLDINSNWNTQPILYVQETYNIYQTQNLDNNGQATGGDALASYLLGLPFSSTRRNTNVELHNGWEDGFYIQDQWHATQKLEVNLGFRYDLSLWPIYGSYDHNDIFVGDTDMDTGLYILQAVPPGCYTGASPCIPTATGALPADVVVTTHGNHSIVNNVYDNWQPRIGISYLVTPNTVIRAAGGRYFDSWAAVNQNASNYQGSWPDTSYLSNTQLNSPYPTASTGANPLGLGSGAEITPAATPFGQTNFFVDPNYKDAYAIEYNLGVQQQLGKGTLIEADYVGSHSLRLDSNLVRNTSLYPAAGSITARSPFSYITPTQYEKSNSNGNYNALQTKVSYNFGKSSTLLASYTWSKTIDLGCDGYFGGATSCSVQNPYNMIADGDRSVAGFDVPQNLAVSFVYALPIGTGKLVNISNRALNEVAGGWSLNGIYTARSGVPFHGVASSAIPNTGNNYERPNKTCSNPYQSGGSRQLLNKTCFAVPNLYTFGTEPRNDLRTPHVTNLDASVEKDFPWGEERSVEFKTDFFNTFNVHAFAAPDTTVTDSNFGLSTATSDIEREIQFSLKIKF